MSSLCYSKIMTHTNYMLCISNIVDLHNIMSIQMLSLSYISIYQAVFISKDNIIRAANPTPIIRLDYDSVPFIRSFIRLFIHSFIIIITFIK